MLEFIVSLRDVLFALLLSWAGIGDDDSGSNKSGEEATLFPTVSAPFKVN